MSNQNIIYVAKVWIDTKYLDGSDCVEEFSAGSDSEALSYVIRKYGEDKYFSLRRKNSIEKHCFLITVWKKSSFPTCSPLKYEIYALDDDSALEMIFKEYSKNEYYLGIVLKNEAERIR